MAISLHKINEVIEFQLSTVIKTCPFNKYRYSEDFSVAIMQLLKQVS